MLMAIAAAASGAFLETHSTADLGYGLIISWLGASPQLEVRLLPPSRQGLLSFAPRLESFRNFLDNCTNAMLRLPIRVIVPKFTHMADYAISTYAAPEHNAVATSRSTLSSGDA
jgi:hypothetical protein